MPVRVTPQQATAKWLTGISGANERMKQGALNVQTAPGQLAAAAADKWLAKVTAAKPKFIANSKAISLQDWQNAYINTGLPRVTQGAQDKQAKYTNAMGPFFNYMNQGLQAIDKMPNNTIEDAVQRAGAMIRWNAKYVKGNAVAGS